MLQQILKDMYIDPDVLNALNDDQKKTLFLKMRQEQVRRWKEREEKLQEEHEENKTTKPKRANSKSVSWLLGRDGDVSVLVIGDVDELTSKFICSGFGENKAQSHQSNSYLQTILKSRKSTEAVKSERENVVCTTRPGISVNVKEKHEATNTSLPLLVSVSERSSPSAAHQRELKSQLSICSSSPERVSPVDTRPGLADMRQSAPSVPSHCGTTAATSSNMCSKEPQQSQESHGE
uniref:uncharacterized protein zgc:100829 n=1 Tax=Solea senegalensis TaxID=28829 RepID=UPI001CD85CAD|nr:uncharacterized protein zgc:100829 [Solea senegalensis]XP_043897367.1 uncharacterized protein zgc:100829 [Solea senegalensis]